MSSLDELERENQAFRARNDTTDRVEAEASVLRSEALFRAVIEKSAEVISLTAADGTTRYLTPTSAARVLGWTPDELIGRTPREQVIPEDQERIAAELAQLMRGSDRDMSMEFRIRHRDGSIRWIESTGTNLLADPDVRAVVGNYRDVTARKQAEHALLEGHDLLEEAQAIAHVGSWIATIGPSDELRWSRECYRIFGLPVGTTMTTTSFLTHVHPADLEAVRRSIHEAFVEGTPTDIEHRVVRPDGTIRWVQERAVVEHDAAGAPTRVVGTVQDITERRLAAEELRASEERYRRIIESTSEGVWTYDANAITTFMNTRMAEMLGYTIEEAVRMPVYAFMDARRTPEADIRIERRRRGVTDRSDFQLRRKDGTTFWASIQANSLFDDQQRFEGALLVVSDISGQRRDDELRARLAAIVESSEDAIFGEGLDAIITTWNLGAEKLFQYTAEEMVGRSSTFLIPTALVDEERRVLAPLALGQAVRQHDTKRLRKDGTEIEVALTISPIRDARGVVIGASKIARDLTARREAAAALRRTEEQFRQAQKMEAVGRLAGGVAHDFNNLLSVIVSYTHLAIEGLTPGDPLRADMEEILTAGERAAELTRQLLTFSRQQVLQPRVLEMRKVVGAMERMLRRLLGEDVELTIFAPEKLGRVLADPGQIEQIVMNLAVNARDAMPDGGQLAIEMADIDLDDAYVGVAPGEYVMLAVSDNGVGMDAATCARIFEPFFTTKPVGKGTGLGLATVFGIAKQSGGHVAVYSEPGGGTTFKVYLPRTDRVSIPPNPPGLHQVLRGSETILLVEDEEQVRTVACAILRRLGYNVLDASNAGEAYLISKDFPAKIHLLLTDVVLPRMSGRKLVEQLAPQRPEMRVLYASGYTDDAIVHHGVLDAGVAFLQKPFTPDALLRKVREVLDA